MKKNSAYQLIDSGDGYKLERFGEHLLVRPSPAAVWQQDERSRALWAKSVATYIRSNSGGGQWEGLEKLPEQWTIYHSGMHFTIKPTGFGHVGIFPEQNDSWGWISTQVAKAPGISVLNMFGYTGGSTLFAAKAGADVCHLDASRGAVSWGRENLALNGLDGCKVRWIVEDVRKFVKRELRRGASYDAFILDPPSFGRGVKGELWKIEEHLWPLLEDLRKLASAKPRFVLLSCHTPGYTPASLRNIMAQFTAEWGAGEIEAAEHLIPHERCMLPSGAYARWSAS